MQLLWLASIFELAPINLLTLRMKRVYCNVSFKGRLLQEKRTCNFFFFFIHYTRLKIKNKIKITIYDHEKKEKLRVSLKIIIKLREIGIQSKLR